MFESILGMARLHALGFPISGHICPPGQICPHCENDCNGYYSPMAQELYYQTIYTRNKMHYTLDKQYSEIHDRRFGFVNYDIVVS